MSRAREFADLAGSADAGGITGRNLVINGAYQVFQRATAATTADGGYNTADRWRMGEAGDGAYTTERSTDHPNGSGYSLKAQVTTADTSVAAGHYAYIYQQIEAQNLQHLLYGTSAAKTLTLSFFVKSNKTGIYVFDLRKPDNTHLHYNEEFTISSANTWEKKTITIVPDSNVTASGGAIANDNGSGLEVGIGLKWGSTYTGGTSGSWSTNSNDYATSNQVNWMDSTSNNFYLTEVQLEVGDKATPFEHRSFADELHRCHRYFQGQGTTAAALDASGNTKQTAIFANGKLASTGSSTYHRLQVPMQTRMRSAPTAYVSDNNGTLGKAYYNGANATVTTYIATETTVVFRPQAAATSTATDIWINYSLESEL